MKWVSVKDGLPKINTTCWVYGVIGGEKTKQYKTEDFCVTIAWMDKKGWYYASDCCRDDTFVVAVEWYIPLEDPEIPK